MKISNVKISNWRSIVFEDICFEDLMIFIGQNNHGKSNILSSILFFFGEINHQNLDFNGEAEELWVEMEFEDLSESEGITFKKYVSADNKIRVRKTSQKSRLATVASKETKNLYVNFRFAKRKRSIA